MAVFMERGTAENSLLAVIETTVYQCVQMLKFCYKNSKGAQIETAGKFSHEFGAGYTQ
jgi:hypothetical protein